jgi:hypothetical protein
MKNVAQIFGSMREYSDDLVCHLTRMISVGISAGEAGFADSLSNRDCPPCSRRSSLSKINQQVESNLQLCSTIEQEECS